MSIYTVLIIAVVAGAGYLYQKSKSDRKSQQELLNVIGGGNPEDTADIVPTEALYKESLQRAGLAEHWDFLKQLLRTELRMKPVKADEASIAVGETKIGGQPDLPIDMEWPREDNGKALSFIAQINMRYAGSLDSSGQLPKTGMLYFFYSAELEAWGFDPEDQDKFKVVYYDGDLSSLQRKQFPFELAEEARYSPVNVKLVRSISLPHYEQQYIIDRIREPQYQAYADIQTNYSSALSKLLGHAENIQNPMEPECELVTHGINTGTPDGYNDPRVPELRKAPNDWIPLLHVSSEEESGMMWGDMGILYFWIKKEDLKNRRFDKCWLILQCY